MGRNKKKQVLSDLSSNDSDGDVSDKVHERFLENVKQFQGKPKIKPPTRNELANEVSEFNFSSKKKTDKKKSNFREDDLLHALKKKKPQVAHKLQAAKKTKTMSKPMETVYEKKAQREIGFENVKKNLSRWKDVVQSNRLADQLHFPLKSRKIEIFDHTETDLFSTLGNPTPFEQEMAEVLNSSDVVKEDKKKMEKSKFRLTLKELIEKRKMMSKVKAQASYKIAKARRQNKIKSKKYHRILRNEKTKQQLKEFEELQKKDPETALKRLESLEKSRAQERATLRHRNTGKWAQNQVIKAKYNKESRVALSEQLNKNRELTQKLHVESEDDSDQADMNTDSVNVNPNTVAEENEYAKFVTNYKKFWEEKNEKTTDVEKSDSESNSKIDNEKVEVTEVKLEIGKEEKPIVSKPKKLKKKKLSEKPEKEVGLLEKPEPIAEIVNSSGCWTVTNTRVQLENKITKSKDTTKKTSSSSSGNVGELFKNLENKINRKLKHKLTEIRENEETEEKTAKKKKMKKNKNNEGQKDDKKVLLSESFIADEDPSDRKGDLSTTAVNHEANQGELKNLNLDSTTWPKPRRLATEIPDLMTAGDDAIDDEENEYNNQLAMTIGEAFAEEDVTAEFQEEKKNVTAESEPKIIDTSLPGWGSWTDSSSINNNGKPQKAKRTRIDKRLLFRIPKMPPRRDANKGHVILKEEKSDQLKEHLVNELPHPFTQVKDYEASIRAPIGRTWLPETAHRQLIAPPVVTKLGTVIEPMDEGELVQRSDD